MKAKKVLVKCGIVVLVIAIIVVVILGLTNQSNKKDLDSTTTMIKASFENIAELATEEYNFTSVAMTKKEKLKLFDINIPFTTKTVLLTYSGTVKAGIKDFTSINPVIVDEEKTINIEVPKAEVLSTYIDPKSIETYDQTHNIFNPLEVEDITDLLAGEEEKAEANAIDEGILDKAQTRAAEIIKSNIKSLLSNTERADYTINVICEE